MGNGRLNLSIDVASEPITGWVAQPEGGRRQFAGWVELTAAIDAARRGLELDEPEGALQWQLQPKPPAER